MERKVRKSDEILKAALNDDERKKHGLCVVFVGSEKYPKIKGWQEYASTKQTRKEIKNLFQRNGRSTCGFSYYTGVNGLVDIDFDWEMAYHVAIREFGERMNTRTLRTPSGGYRLLFIVDKPKDYLEFKQSPPHVEIPWKTHPSGSCIWERKK